MTTAMPPDVERAWAAGLFEGEGCFTARGHNVSLKACLGMTDEEVVRRFAAVVGVGNVYDTRYQSHPRWKRQWQWVAGSQSDVLYVYRLLEPWLHSRRRQRFAELLAARREYEERLPEILADRQLEAGRRGGRPRSPKADAVVAAMLAGESDRALAALLSADDRWMVRYYRRRLEGAARS